MATALEDVPGTLFAGMSIPTDEYTASGNGTAIDLTNADGACFAIYLIGSLSEGAELSGKIQESADGTNWVDLPGAEFAPRETAGIEMIRFQRNLRFARAVMTLAGDTPSSKLAVMIGQRTKLI